VRRRIEQTVEVIFRRIWPLGRADESVRLIEVLSLSSAGVTGNEEKMNRVTPICRVAQRPCHFITTRGASSHENWAPDWARGSGHASG
jgi:hypothetical protein